jgi:hypothetical protein
MGEIPSDQYTQMNFLPTLNRLTVTDYTEAGNSLQWVLRFETPLTHEAGLLLAHSAHIS